MNLAGGLLVVLVTGVPGGGCADGSDQRVGPEATGIEFQGGPDSGRERVVRLAGLSVRVGCLSYGTRTGPYLALTAETASSDARARVSFRTERAGSQDAHRFAMGDFDPSYGEWDLLGSEPGPVEGRLTYAPADGGRVRLDFEGSGGRADGSCHLRGDLGSAGVPSE